MKKLEGIVGQARIVERLRDFARLYLETGEVPDHILFVGPSGMGQKTLVDAFASDLGASLTVTDASLLKKKGDLTAIITSLDDGSHLYLEEINRLKPALAELLVTAIRDFRIDLLIGQGPGSRIHPYNLNRFSLIASVRREQEISSELRQEFGLVLQLQEYSSLELEAIVACIANKLSILVNSTAAALVARAAAGSPHQVEFLLRRMTRGDKRQLSEADARGYFSIRGIGTQPESSPLGRASFDNLSGIEFERLIGTLLSRMGFRVEMTKASGDGGVDLIATLEKALIGGRYLIQCKRFAVGAPIGAPVVREFYGGLTADQRAVKGIFITTSNFTEQAKEFAKSLPIELIDREILQRLLDEYELGWTNDSSIIV